MVLKGVGKMRAGYLQNNNNKNLAFRKGLTIPAPLTVPVSRNVDGGFSFFNSWYKPQETIEFHLNAPMVMNLGIGGVEF